MKKIEAVYYQEGDPVVDRTFKFLNDAVNYAETHSVLLRRKNADGYEYWNEHTQTWEADHGT